MDFSSVQTVLSFEGLARQSVHCSKHLYNKMQVPFWVSFKLLKNFDTKAIFWTSAIKFHEFLFF